jgi:hypothetical protein
MQTSVGTVPMGDPVDVQAVGIGEPGAPRDQWRVLPVTVCLAWVRRFVLTWSDWLSWLALA